MKKLESWTDYTYTNITINITTADSASSRLAVCKKQKAEDIDFETRNSIVRL